MKQKIRTILVEDERLAREELKKMLSAFKEIEVIDEAKNVSEGIQKIELLKPDLIFLDIQMPGNKTGFDLLEVLEYMPKVIFTTAHDEFALKAFEVSALDYLLKPIDTNRLREAVTKLLNGLPGKQDIPNEEKKLGIEDNVFVKEGERCWFVKLSDVRYFESSGNYAKVYFGKYKPLILKSLNALEERLDDKYFFRCSRKHIINLNYIDNIQPYFNGGFVVHLSCGAAVEVSRRQAVKFKEMMSL